MGFLTIADCEQAPEAMSGEFAARENELNALQKECARRWPDAYL